jgi:glucose dehydrogenase
MSRGPTLSLDDCVQSPAGGVLIESVRAYKCVVFAVAVSVCFVAGNVCAASPGEPATKSVRRGAVMGQTIEWTSYANDAGGTKYSPAAQITRNNVSKLTPAWTYRTGDYGIGTALVRDETTPLFVDGVLYASTPFGGVRALDGASGRELWAFDSELDLEARSRRQCSQIARAFRWMTRHS